MKNTKKVSRRAGVRSGGSAAAGSTAARTRVTRRTQSVRQPNPKTAYELLQRVCDHILEEPKRYFQGVWIERNKRLIKDDVGAVPPCGTMACRAGWIVVLNDGLNCEAVRASIACSGFIQPIQQRANEILGTTTFQTADLFNGAALHRQSGHNDVPTAGTRAYARLGVKGLRAFMEQHAAHLKARLLKDVPKLEGQA